jgi:hypothetical protein
MQVAGRIIADPKTFWAFDRFTNMDHDIFGNEPTAFLSGDGFAKMPACTCTVCSSVMKEDNTSKSKFWNFDGIESFGNVGSDHDELFFVCTHRIIAFVTGQRVWKRLRISGAKEPEWDVSMIDNRLVIDQDNLRTIKVLASRYTKYSETEEDDDEENDEKDKKDKTDEKKEPQHEAAIKPWAADFIERKGDNAIFLLHGRPGGKRIKEWTLVVYADMRQWARHTPPSVWPSMCDGHCSL